MKNLTMAVIVALAMFAGVGTGTAAPMVINHPNQMVDISYSQYIHMALEDNLMERVDGVDTIVDKGDGEYYIYFMETVDENLIFGGYVWTDNASSNNDVGSEGFCDGLIDRNVFSEGSSPDYVIGFYDDDGGQFALYYSNGSLVFDENLVFWTTGDAFASLFVEAGKIEYDGVADGLLDFEITYLSGTIILEHTVLVPEPATMVLLSVGGLVALRRRKKK